MPDMYESECRRLHRISELLTRLAGLQAQLTVCWSEMMVDSGLHFTHRLSALEPHDAVQTCEVWVDCMEQAYARMVRQDVFCRLQGTFVNTFVSLMLDLRGRGGQNSKVAGRRKRRAPAKRRVVQPRGSAGA